MKKGLGTVLTTIIGAAVGAIAMNISQTKKIEKKQEKVDKFKNYYTMLNQWLMLKQEGKSLEKYFIDNGYKTIAIYGMGEMGNRLYDELKDSKLVEVKYAIDQNAATTYSELEVVEKDDNLAEADVMVVTATFAYEEIEKEMSEKVDFPIISLEDVVYEI